MAESLTEGETRHGCWAKKSGFEKKVIIIVTIIAIILVVSIIIILTGFFWIPYFVKPQTYSICNNVECQAAAKRLKMSLNESASACDDFYEYACGGWMQMTNIPADKGSWGAFHSLREKLKGECIPLLQNDVKYDLKDEFHFPKDAVENARAFFQACVDIKTHSKESSLRQGEMASLKSALQSIGCRIPMKILNKTDFKIKPWNILISNARRKFGLSLLMTLDVDVDEKNPEGYIIYLDQALHFGLDRHKLIDLEKNKIYVDAYKTYIRSMMCLLNGETKCPDDYREFTIQKIVEFESRIAKLTKEPGLRRDPRALYVKMPLSKLQKNTGWDWKDLIDDVFLETGQTVTQKTEVVVKEEAYFKSLVELLEEEDPSIVSEYVCVRALQRISPFTSNDFREKEFHFERVVSGIQKAPDIKVKCFDETNDFYGYAVGRLYVLKSFHKAAKQDMVEMEKKIADAFKKIIDESTWMDSETKKQSAVKLSQMVPMIGYPEWILNRKDLNKYYAYLQGIAVGNFTDFLVRVMHAKALDDLKKLNRKANRAFDWNTAPSIVNAFYMPSANTITFPAGILQPPFYQHNTLNSLNYGGIGYVIGHEITHGYDDQGCEYNGVGKLESWWTNDTKERYNEKKKCFIDQYSNIQVDVGNNEKLNVKGNLTIGENIADNGGIREAYMGFLATGEGDKRLPGLEHLNSKKLFFLAAASTWCTKFRAETLKNKINLDEHSPGMVRATIPLANTEEFAHVFGCKRGSKMNPLKKCVLW